MEAVPQVSTNFHNKQKHKRRGDALEKVIGILEEHSGYPKRLARYINDKNDIGYIAVVFRSIEEVLCFQERTPLSVLLIGDGCSKEEQRRISALFPKSGQIFILSEESGDKGQLLPSGMRRIFRYQRAGELLRQILQQETETVSSQGGLYTVYSPDSCSCSEHFAWQLAKRLSAQRKTLFLSWEPFGGFGRSEMDRGETCGDLSELLYVLRLESFSKKDRLLTLPSKEGVFYISGTAYCTDLWQYSAEELLHFLVLCRECGYEAIVFLAGFFSESIEQLMEQSEAVCLVTENDTDEKRRKEFFRQMKYAGKQVLLSRVKEVGKYDADIGSESAGKVSELLWKK